MKNLIKFALVAFVAFIATSCGYKSVIEEIPGTDLSTFSAKTKTEKIVLGVMKTTSGERLIPAAYDAITLQNGCLVADYTTKEGNKLCNLFLLNGQKALNENLQSCEWTKDHFRATNSKGEFLYYPETSKVFGPYQISVNWGEFLFFQTEKGTGIASKTGIIMPEQKEIFFVKDKKTDAFFFVIPDGRKATLFDATGKEMKKLTSWGWTQLQKKLADKATLIQTITMGTVPNIKAF